MRGRLPLTLLLLSAAQACGRIGYTPIADFVDGSSQTGIRGHDVRQADIVSS